MTSTAGLRNRKVWASDAMLASVDGQTRWPGSDARSIIATGVSGAMPAASNWAVMSSTFATPM